MNDVQFEEIKKIELEILQEFIRICEKLNLRWYGGYGTALGAQRHKGFIPWDDDIDVLLPRKDYEIFCKSAQKYMKENYFLQTDKTDPEYIQTFAKIRRSDTTFLEIASADKEINHGIYIDVFPLDGYPTNKFEELMFKYKRVIYDCYIYQNGDRSALSGFRKWIVSIHHLICGKLSGREALEKKNKLVSRVDYDKAQIVSCMVEDYPKRESVPKEYFGEGKIVKFENINIVVPEELDKYLTHLYGDYMKYPPVEERKPIHQCLVIDTKKSYLEYENGKVNRYE